MSGKLVGTSHSEKTLAGRYRVTGTVTRLGVAGPYTVVLFLRRTLLPINKTTSTPIGEYSFNYLPYVPNGYFAVAFDHGDNPLNAAIADLITPEAMP